MHGLHSAAALITAMLMIDKDCCNILDMLLVLKLLNVPHARSNDYAVGQEAEVRSRAGWMAGLGLP